MQGEQAVVVARAVGRRRVGLAARLGLEQVPWLGGSGKPAALVQLLLVSAAFGATYLLMARLLRLREVQEVVALVLGRFGRRAASGPVE